MSSGMFCDRIGAKIKKFKSVQKTKSPVLAGLYILN